MRILISSQNTSRVSIVLILYWLLLLAWQNSGFSGNHSSVDIVIKLVLILSLSTYYIFHSKTINKTELMVFMVLLLCMYICCINDSFKVGEIISYAYPLLIVFTTLILGDNYHISHKQLLNICSIVIFADLYMCIYAVIFCKNQFINAFSISKAYGNELKSFLFSNHEYGLYLLFGIICCLIVLKTDKEKTTKRRRFYFFIVLLFTVNLVLTYSRTTLLGFAVFVFTYLMLNRKTIKQLIIYVLISATLVFIYLNPMFSKFFVSIVLKDNYTAGRASLMKMSWAYFSDGTIIDKLFGHGVARTDEYFDMFGGHTSTHNAYLQVLCCYGVIIFILLLLYFVSQIVYNYQFIKKNRFMGSVFVALMLSCASMMFTNTTIIFSSTIDSYFMTLICILIPKYYRNSEEINLQKENQNEKDLV